MSKTSRSLLLALLILVTLLPALLWMRGDRYDYVAAFENPARREPPLVQIPAVAGGDEARVAQWLGEPIACERTAYGAHCRYRPGNAEIAYIDGRADWITVTGFGDTPPSPDALTRLGLRPEPPTRSSETALQWQDSQALLEFALVHDGSRIRYARIKVSTP